MFSPATLPKPITRWRYTALGGWSSRTWRIFSTVSQGWRGWSWWISSLMGRMVRGQTTVLRATTLTLTNLYRRGTCPGRGEWGLLSVSQVSQDRQHNSLPPVHDDDLLLRQPPVSDHLPSQPGRRLGGEYRQDAKVKKSGDCLERLQWVCAHTRGLQNMEAMSQNSPEAESPPRHWGETQERNDLSNKVRTEGGNI